MDRKERLAMLELELRELSNLVSAMKQIDIVPSVLIEMACDKSARLHDGIKKINGEYVPEVKPNAQAPKADIPQPVADVKREPAEQETVHVQKPVAEAKPEKEIPVSVQTEKAQQEESKTVKPEAEKAKVKISFFGSFPSFRPKKQSAEEKTEKIIEQETGEDALKSQHISVHNSADEHETAVLSDVPSEMDIEEVVNEVEETKIGIAESEDDSDFQEKVLDYEETQDAERPAGACIAQVADNNDEVAAEIRNTLCESLADDEVAAEKPVDNDGYTGNGMITDDEKFVSESQNGDAVKAAEIIDSLSESLNEDELAQDEPFSVTDEYAANPSAADVQTAEVDKKDYEDYDDSADLTEKPDSECAYDNEDNSSADRCESTESAENTALSQQNILREPKAESAAMELDKSNIEIEKPFFEKITQSYSDKNITASGSGDIRRYMTINDRFLFLRELFKGDIGMLNHTLDMINRMNSFAEASAYLNKEFSWKQDAPAVESFMQMIERHFGNKQF